MSPSDDLSAAIRLQGAACEELRCPFYAELCAELANDVEHDAPIARFLAPFRAAPFEDMYILRVLGGVHRLVLSGVAPAVAAHYPSVGGDADARAAARAVEALLADPSPVLVDALRRPPQTNEVGRAAALASGLAVVADETRLPIRLRELGSSAGLNLRLDSYWYEHAGVGWGNTSSAIRFVDVWNGGAGPPFGVGVEIVDRRGCDRDPIDPTTPDGAMTLLSYVWPQPPERFTRARDAITAARDVEVVIDRADIADWLPAQLAEPRAGTALVVMHSIVWQYLDASTKAAVGASFDEAGANATPESPVGWLRLEPNPTTYWPAELRLTLWDGRDRESRQRLIATSSFHGGEMNWRA